MNVKQALYFFGTQSEMARQLGVTRQYISKWAVDNKIPIVYQYMIENLTSGKLFVEDKKIEVLPSIKFKKFKESMKKKVKDEIEQKEKLQIKLNKKLEKAENVINEKIKKAIKIKEKLEELEKSKIDLLSNLQLLEDNKADID